MLTDQNQRANAASQYNSRLISVGSGNRVCEAKGRRAKRTAVDHRHDADDVGRIPQWQAAVSAREPRLPGGVPLQLLQYELAPPRPAAADQVAGAARSVVELVPEPGGDEVARARRELRVYPPRLVYPGQLSCHARRARDSDLQSHTRRSPIHAWGRSQQIDIAKSVLAAPAIPRAPITDILEDRVAERCLGVNEEPRVARRSSGSALVTCRRCSLAAKATPDRGRSTLSL